MDVKFVCSIGSLMTAGCMENLVKPTAKTDTGEEMQLPSYKGRFQKIVNGYGHTYSRYSHIGSAGGHSC